MHSIMILGNDEYSKHLREELKKHKYKLFFSDKLKPGLAKARLKNPELLIINSMSYGNFMIYDLIKEIRSDSRLKDKLIIVMSDSGDDFDKAVAIELGADDYMMKPTNINEILLKLKCYLKYTS